MRTGRRSQSRASARTEVRGSEREHNRRRGGRQRPRESNDQAPGPVGADHAANSRTFPRTTAATKRRSTSSSGGSTARIGAAKEAIRWLTRARRLGPRSPSSRLSPTNPSTRRMTASRARRRVHGPPRARAAKSVPTPMRGTGVRDDRTCSDAQRNISDADGHIPTLAEQARTREVDGPDTVTHVSHRGVGPDWNAPRDRVRHPVREQPAQASSRTSATSAGHPQAARTPNTSSSRSDNPTVRDVTYPMPDHQRLFLCAIGCSAAGHAIRTRSQTRSSPPTLTRRPLRTTSTSATWPNPWHPVHRHDAWACKSPIGGEVRAPSLSQRGGNAPAAGYATRRHVRPVQRDARTSDSRHDGDRSRGDGCFVLRGGSCA